MDENKQNHLHSQKHTCAHNDTQYLYNTYIPTHSKRDKSIIHWKIIYIEILFSFSKFFTLKNCLY